MSIQANLAQKIKSVFSDAVVKKVDKDNFLDIHIPGVNEKRGTHLFFNTGKGKIKMGFYCRDKDFVETLLLKDSDKSGLEEYSQGIRPFNNPEFESVDDAVACALVFVENMGGTEALEGTNAPKNSYDVKEEFVNPVCDLIKMYRILPHFPFIVNSLNEEGYVLENKSCWFYAQDIQWADRNDSWNLLIDHNGFYSTKGEKEFELLFPWDSVAEIKTRIADDKYGMTIGLFQEDGQHLTLTQSGSMSLLIVYWLYQKIVCDIIENFKGQASISWNFVEKELQVRRQKFDSYDNLYEIIPPELLTD